MRYPKLPSGHESLTPGRPDDLLTVDNPVAEASTTTTSCLETRPLLYNQPDLIDDTLDDPIELSHSSFPSSSRSHQASSPSFFPTVIMEKLKKSKVKYYADKLAVDAEPGLTNAQLMLTNFDLKPGIVP